MLYFNWSHSSFSNDVPNYFLAGVSQILNIEPKRLYGITGSRLWTRFFVPDIMGLVSSVHCGLISQSVPIDNCPDHQGLVGGDVPGPRWEVIKQSIFTSQGPGNDLFSRLLGFHRSGGSENLLTEIHNKLKFNKPKGLKVAKEDQRLTGSMVERLNG